MVEVISGKIFRSLEGERKTASLISKASARLGLNVNQALIDTAMPYFEARHILVHQDGKADQAYRQKYPTITLRNGKVHIDAGFIAAARNAVNALAEEIDRQVIGANLVKPEHIHGA